MHGYDFNIAMDVLMNAVNERIQSRKWHQTLSGRGPRADLSQQFTLGTREGYTVGWNKRGFLVGAGKDKDWEFPIKPSDNPEEYEKNVEEALEKALTFIKYQL